MPVKFKYPKCIYCFSNYFVIKYGKRLEVTRYLCKSCGKTFSKDYTREKISSSSLFNQYLDGISIRKIADEHNVSATTIFRKCGNLLKKLPNNLELTKQYCDVKKYSGFLIFDGKYVAIKGYDTKIPLLWGLDFHTHDIPHFVLAPTESYNACLTYFSTLRSLRYDLKYLVCDDNQATKMAARSVYPNVVIQTCLTHYKETLRRGLAVRSSTKYREFFTALLNMFLNRLCCPELVLELANIYSTYGSDPKCSYWMEDIMNRKEELTNYHMFENTPNTTNLIEVYNSHLQARLKGIKGFESYNWAKLWLNAYILRRRLRSFSDCTDAFKHLNGICSLQTTLKEGLLLPTLFG